MTPKRREKLERYIREASVDDLQEISGMLNARYHRMKVADRRTALATLKIGDEVELVNIKPRYMNGTLVTITSILGTRFAVRCTGPMDPRGQARFGGSFRVPADCLRKVS